MFEDVGFHDFKISVKHHDVITMVETYRLLASKGDCRCTSASPRPAPLGKAPSILPGVRCALGRGHWRHDSRVSLRAAGRRGQGGLQTLGIHGIAPPQVRHHLLPELRPRPSGCDPARLRRHRRPEGRDRADPSGRHGLHRQRSGRGTRSRPRRGLRQWQGQIFIKGKVIKTVPEDQIVDTLLTIANDIAAQMEADGQVPVNSTGPVVVPIQHPGH